MVRPPELWAFVIANVGLFVVSSVLMALSHLAYRQSDGESSYRVATVGFGFVVLGGLVEPVYQLGVRGDYYLNGAELLVLQSSESALITLGLALLFYAITHHSATSSPAAETYATDGGERFSAKTGRNDD